MKAGRKSGFDEGYALGAEEGTTVGLELGRILARLYRILHADTVVLTESQLQKIGRLWHEIFSFPMDNREDPEKAVRLLRIRSLYKELRASSNLSVALAGELLLHEEPTEASTAKAKFDF